MTRLQLNQYARFLLDQNGTSWLPDSDLGRFDMNELLLRGYEKVAIETRALKVIYTLAATIGTPLYSFSQFGTSSAGGRIFEITHLAYNAKALPLVNENYLDQHYPDWRFQANGDPRYWVANDAQTIRLYPAPNATLNITIEGYETPDPTTFDSDSESPANPGGQCLLHQEDQTLIAVWAALLAVTRGNAASEMAQKALMLMKMWEDGLRAAKRRISGHSVVQVGRYAKSQMSTDWPPASRNITIV